jgi:hypothetical protein
MGAKRGYAHATRHSDCNADTSIHCFSDYHTDCNGYPDCIKCSHIYNDCNQCANFHSDSNLRFSHHAANCYRYDYWLPHFNPYPYPCSLTVQIFLPGGA